MPFIVSIPYFLPAFIKSSRPKTQSWSVSATAERFLLTASLTISSGVYVPSENVE